MCACLRVPQNQSIHYCVCITYTDHFIGRDFVPMCACGPVRICSVSKWSSWMKLAKRLLCVRWLMFACIVLDWWFVRSCIDRQRIGSCRNYFGLHERLLHVCPYVNVRQDPVIDWAGELLAKSMNILGWFHSYFVWVRHTPFSMCIIIETISFGLLTDHYAH